jgi:hypothetical protein
MKYAPLLLVLALTLAAAPARPAPEKPATETIRLTFISASDLERMMDAAPQAPGTGGLGGSNAFPMPRDVTAWAVDVEHNSLSVTGTPEAIRELTGIVRLLDVPATRVRVVARVLRVTAADRAFIDPEGALLPPGAELRPDEAPSKMLSTEQAGLMAQKPMLAVTDMVVLSSRSLRIRWTGPGGTAGAAVVTPRVNGDQSITTGARFAERETRRPTTSSKTEFSGGVILRANSAATWIAVQPSGLALMLTETVLPPAR